MSKFLPILLFAALQVAAADPAVASPDAENASASEEELSSAPAERLPGTGDERAVEDDPSLPWDQRLQRAANRITAARLRAARAEAAYSRARHDGHPRGEALAKIKDEWEGAAEELQAARDALPDLVEQARRDGAEASVLRPYWDE